MIRKELVNEILSSLSEEEWEALEKKTYSVPVSDHNREVLLIVKNYTDHFFDEIPDSRVEGARAAIEDFLNKTWADEPEAHKYVINASLALTFLFELPMHPWQAVKYTSKIIDGKEHYYCPAKEEGGVCDYCIAEAEQ